MVDFRYSQFCPLTRAVEILGERWTILILRELFLGPKRFSDLKSALNGVSPSVLADRLGKLEERGIVVRREVAPPAATAVYELDEAGRALRPLLMELTRWGLRFLGTPAADDRIRPEWLLLGFEVFARSRGTEEIGARLHIEGSAESIDVYVRGSSGGTTVSGTPLPHEITVSAPPTEMMMFVSGFLPPQAAGPLRFDGDAGVASRIPALFDFTPTPATPTPAISPSDQPPANRATRRKLKPAADSGYPGGAGS